jgi:putative acetyltransferase
MDTQFGSLRITDIDPTAAQHLTTEAMVIFQKLYPEESNHLVVDDDLRADSALFLGAHLGNRVVGCVGLVPGSEEHAGEIKRFYVEEGYRTGGIGGALMDALEGMAQAHGIRLMQLETGIQQQEAVRLYEKRGYSIVPAFGEYIEDEFSLFMEKQLV